MTHRHFEGILLTSALFLAVSALHAQAPAKAPPDTVVFANGEKLEGHFDGFTSGAAKFKSDQLRGDRHRPQ